VPFVDTNDIGNTIKQISAFRFAVYLLNWIPYAGAIILPSKAAREI